MRIDRRLIPTVATLGSLLTSSACFSAPVTERDMPGRYVLNDDSPTDSIDILGGGRYIHYYVSTNGKPVVDTATWQLHKEKDGDVRITFWNWGVADGERSVSVPPVEKAWDGGIEIVLDYDTHRVYNRR